MATSIVRRALIFFCTVTALACGADESRELQRPDLAISGVCDALRATPETAFVVQGEFGGFGYETNSQTAFIYSESVCPGFTGAAFVIARLRDRSEADKLFRTRPRGKRTRVPGEIVTVAGFVERVDTRNRVVELRRAIVR